MQQVILNVDSEFKAAGDLIYTLIKDIKAGKNVAEIAADVLPTLMIAVSGYSAFAADVKKVDNQVYLVKALADALEAKA